MIVLMLLLGLACLAKAVWAIWTGKLSVKRGVIRRSDDPFSFYVIIGAYLSVPTFLLDASSGFRLLFKLIDLMNL